MKWIKAVEQIEQALAAGKAVSVRYHRRWITKFPQFDKVDSVVEYDWWNNTKGCFQICKAVNTYHKQLNEGSHIIDEVIIEER
jgi:hypothetical protein